MSAWDLENVGEVLGNPSADWFTARVLKLARNGDAELRKRLRVAFAAEVDAVEAWEREQRDMGASREDMRFEIETLIWKADLGNLWLLRECFPEEVSRFSGGAL